MIECRSDIRLEPLIQIDLIKYYILLPNVSHWNCKPKL